MMNGELKINRSTLEQSGEVLVMVNHQDQQQADDQAVENGWDSLKDIPFRGAKAEQEEFEEDEMSM